MLPVVGNLRENPNTGQSGVGKRKGLLYKSLLLLGSDDRECDLAVAGVREGNGEVWLAGVSLETREPLAGGREMILTHERDM